MRDRVAAASLLLAIVSSGCSGSGNASLPGGSQSSALAATRAVTPDAGTNAFANPGFETGTLSSWSSCGSVNDTSITTVKVHSGSYAALIGTVSKPEVNGTSALCQTVTVPTGATLSFYVYEGTNDTIKYVDQEADLYSTSGSLIKQLYAEASSGQGWVQKSFDLSAYAGQTLQLYFGVKGNGYGSDYVYEDLDDVSLTGTGATAAPTATPTAAPTTSPTSSPTTKPSSSPSNSPTPRPTATPTASPTASPTSAAFTCNNQQFLNDQSEFASGQITADQFVDICGSVTQVLAEKHTASGNHGYFYVQMPSGYNIEIVSNLDAMAQAPTDQPPSTWPWVAVGDYVYVQGRYYYDNSSSQGVDWTEDDTSNSWPHVGYVAVCNSSGANCSKYW